MLKYEMKRAFGKNFWIALLIGVISGLGGIVSYLLDCQYLPAESVSCFDAWLYCLSVGEGSFFRAVFPIIICLPYIFTFYTDQQSTFIYFLLSRISYKKYLIYKCALGGISAVTLILSTNAIWLIAVFFLFPTNIPDTILNLQMGGAYSWLYQSNPMRYIGIQIWFGILFTVAYYFVSVFFVFMSKKKWQTAALPIFAYFLLIFVSQFFDKITMNPVTYLIPYEAPGLSASGILLGDVLFLTLGVIGIFFNYNKRKEEVLWV